VGHTATLITDASSFLPQPTRPITKITKRIIKMVVFFMTSPLVRFNFFVAFIREVACPVNEKEDKS